MRIPNASRPAAFSLVLLSIVGPVAADEPVAVPTFHCIGLYWRAKTGSPENTCEVRYRCVGSDQWKQALPLWFDERDRQYRGSVVNLKPSSLYEIALSLKSTSEFVRLEAKTWSEDFPIAETVTLPNRSNQTLEVTESGTPEGYILYAPKKSDSATIDVENKHDCCIVVKASYVIIRGLTLRNARIHGIQLADNVHDVVIEQCDISGWGRISEDGWGRNLDSAIYSRAENLKRITIQRNRIHHPRGDSNNWKENRPRPGKRESYHPEGPQAVYFRDSEGNHVIRYNTVLSDDGHQYNDIFGAGANFSTRGFPNRDSDIYGNLLSHCWDDAIESEGANGNVRIWGNYMTDCFVGVACASTSIGPLYVWRNMSNVMRVAPENWSGGFLKTSDKMGGGKIFVFHNTVLQPVLATGEGSITTGASVGLGWGGPMVNVTSRNNILHVKSQAFRDRDNDPLGDYDYDLYQGRLPKGREHQKHGIRALPIYAHVTGLRNGEGVFTLSPNSPGFDAGVRLPNFNDDFTGSAPDMGAHEAGTGPMEYGVNAYSDKQSCQ